MITARAVPAGRRRQPAEPPAREALQADPRAVLLRLRARPAREGLRRRDGALGRPAGLHDDRAALAAAAQRGDQRRRSTAQDDPAAAIVSINPANGAIRAMTADRPGPREQPVQPALAGAAPAGLDVQDVRARRGGRARASTRPRRTTSRRRSPTARLEIGNCDDGTLVVREDVRLELHRLDVGRAGDAPLRQHRLRAADARRRARGGSPRWPPSSACARRSTFAAQYVPAMGLGSIAVSPLDMASAYATLAAGGIYSEPMAIRKVVLPSGKDTDDRLGQAHQRKRVISDGVASEVTRILEENVRYGTGTRAALGRPAAGQDGHDRQARRRLVRAATRPASRPRSGWATTRGEMPMDERARDLRLRRHLPGRDLAALHGARARPACPAREFPEPDAAGRVPAVATRAVGAQLRPVLRATGAGRTDDDDRRRHRAEARRRRSRRPPKPAAAPPRPTSRHRRPVHERGRPAEP